MNKKIISLVYQVFLLLLIFFVSCEEKISYERVPPNLSFLNTAQDKKENPSGRVQSVSWQFQLFALQGDNLYRFHRDTRAIELLGTGWSGTEAVTVFGGYIFGVQAGHLWRCNLTTATCVDLGSNWGGTSFMTNDDTYLYAIQGNRIWKTNINGGFSQLGAGEWGASTEMGFSHGAYVYPSGSPNLWVQWGGRSWRVSNGSGSFAENGIHTLNPSIIPHWWTGDGDTSTIGILNGQLVKCDVAGQLGYRVIAPGDWTGTTDIAITTVCGGNCIPYPNLYLLKNSQIHEFTKIPNSADYSYAGVISGLSGVYKITSMTTR